MRAVIQRVIGGCSVVVESKTVSAFPPNARGLCVLVGIAADDTKEDAEYIIRKILNLRLFENEEGKWWARNVCDLGGHVMLISQFTLCHVLKGNKPDFHQAMKTEAAKAMFEEVVAATRQQYAADRVHTGEFGAMMAVSLVNDGPVTLTLDSKNKNQ